VWIQRGLQGATGRPRGRGMVRQVHSPASARPNLRLKHLILVW